MCKESLILDYKNRFEYYNKKIGIELESLHIARRNGNVEDQIEYRGNVRRLRELRGLAVQIISDLELLD